MMKSIFKRKLVLYSLIMAFVLFLTSFTCEYVALFNAYQLVGESNLSRTESDAQLHHDNTLLTISRPFAVAGGLAMATFIASFIYYGRGTHPIQPRQR